MSINIFLNAYQHPENKLTYNFLALLEMLNSNSTAHFLTGKTTDVKPMREIKTVYGGGETNPDGSFMLKLADGSMITVYYENKTKRRGLSKEQLTGHLKGCTANDLLLVTSPRKSDKVLVDEMQDSRIVFRTWQEISLFLKNTFPDNPIVRQFVDYGKKSGEFDELGEIHKDEIITFCEYIKSDFDRKIESIFRNFIYDADLTKFGFNNINLIYGAAWGRKGAELRMRNGANGTYQQFGAISLYQDTSDHEIVFRNDLPELAFFLDISPGCRSTLQGDQEFRTLVEHLCTEGFESNLDGKLTPNRWRLLLYRQPLSEFTILNVQEILSFTDKVFGKLLKCAASRHKLFAEFM